MCKAQHTFYSDRLIQQSLLFLAETIYCACAEKYSSLGQPQYIWFFFFPTDNCLLDRAQEPISHRYSTSIELLEACVPN